MNNTTIRRRSFPQLTANLEPMPLSILIRLRIGITKGTFKMKLIRIVQLPDAGKTARVVKIKYDGGTEEYVCQLFISGKHYEPADYFTTDNEDAFETAKLMCKAPNQSKG